MFIFNVLRIFAIITRKIEMLFLAAIKGIFPTETTDKQP